MKTFCHLIAGFAVLSITSIIAPATTGKAYAQSLPSCDEQYTDADGDGFGWQSDASCIVDSSTNPPPTFTNKSTGAPVNLIRPYWDGNADFAHRTIQCDRYDYSPVTGIYEPGSDSQGLPNRVTIQHGSLVIPGTPIRFINDGDIVGWYSLQLSTSFNKPLTTVGTPPFWMVEDGLYRSPELLDSPYIELVKTQANNDAIRIWFNSGDRIRTAYEYLARSTYEEEGYFLCYDAAAADFAPTGVFGEAGSPPVSPPSVTTVFTVEPDVAITSDILNRETGAIVPLTKAYWDYNKDLAGRSILCQQHSYREAGAAYNSSNSGRYVYNTSIEDDHHYWMSWMFPGSESSFEYHWNFEGVFRNYAVSIVSGVIHSTNNSPHFFKSDRVELIGNNSIRIWKASGIQYDQCNVQPSGSANNVQDTGTTEGTDVVQANLTSVDNATDDSIVNTDDNTTVQNTNDVQTNTDITDNSSDDSTGNSNDVTTAENENNAVEDEVVVSNTLADTTSTDLVSSDETTSQSGGGSFWLPLLIFALAFRRPLSALRKQN